MSLNRIPTTEHRAVCGVFRAGSQWTRVTVGSQTREVTVLQSRCCRCLPRAARLAFISSMCAVVYTQDKLAMVVVAAVGCLRTRGCTAVPLQKLPASRWRRSSAVHSVADDKRARFVLHVSEL
ncbi:hypothetical protein KUCAC02_020085 [Chaenocephalus aceratus]|uniref:Uncharacterized protein n=1 Tax=Chaenocephalus aceratus TaxID=36190 RepID=A0ACB9VQF7_CHAAC|nr:hypothetical protein KUCAC02_020085 [Chaenocephalus aceratus]